MPIYTCDFSENGTALIRREGDDGLVHRISKTPGLDISELPDNIQEQIDAHWTPEVVAAYAEEQAEIISASPRRPTQDEIDEAQTALVERQGTIIKALATAIYTLANDVRALEGKNSITPTQFRNYIKGLLR